jgi:hypothetical protein
MFQPLHDAVLTHFNITFKIALLMVQKGDFNC